jgi:hypothetical protein
LIPPEIDDIDNIEMVLKIPIATGMFSEYLDTLDDPEETYCFGLFADLRKFDDFCRRGLSIVELERMAL